MLPRLLTSGIICINCGMVLGRILTKLQLNPTCTHCFVKCRVAARLRYSDENTANCCQPFSCGVCSIFHIFVGILFSRRISGCRQTCFWVWKGVERFKALLCHPQIYNCAVYNRIKNLIFSNTGTKIFPIFKKVLGISCKIHKNLCHTKLSHYAVLVHTLSKRVQPMYLR